MVEPLPVENFESASHPPATNDDIAEAALRQGSEQGESISQHPSLPPPPTPASAEITTELLSSMVSLVSLSPDQLAGAHATQVHSSPEDMEFNRIKTTYANMNGDFAPEALASSFLSATPALEPTSRLFSSSVVAAASIEKSIEQDFEVVDGTTIFFDAQPPSAENISVKTADVIQPTVTADLSVAVTKSLDDLEAGKSVSQNDVKTAEPDADLADRPVIQPSSSLDYQASASKIETGPLKSTAEVEKTSAQSFNEAPSTPPPSNPGTPSASQPVIEASQIDELPKTETAELNKLKEEEETVTVEVDRQTNEVEVLEVVSTQPPVVPDKQEEVPETVEEDKATVSDKKDNLTEEIVIFDDSENEIKENNREHQQLIEENIRKEEKEKEEMEENLRREEKKKEEIEENKRKEEEKKKVEVEEYRRKEEEKKKEEIEENRRKEEEKKKEEIEENRRKEEEIEEEKERLSSEERKRIIQEELAKLNSEKEEEILKKKDEIVHELKLDFDKKEHSESAEPLKVELPAEVETAEEQDKETDAATEEEIVEEGPTTDNSNLEIVESSENQTELKTEEEISVTENAETENQTEVSGNPEAVEETVTTESPGFFGSFFGSSEPEVIPPAVTESTPTFEEPAPNVEIPVVTETPTPDYEQPPNFNSGAEIKFYEPGQAPEHFGSHPSFDETLGSEHGHAQNAENPGLGKKEDLVVGLHEQHASKHFLFFHTFNFFLQKCILFSAQANWTQLLTEGSSNR